MILVAPLRANFRFSFSRLTGFLHLKGVGISPRTPRGRWASSRSELFLAVMIGGWLNGRHGKGASRFIAGLLCYFWDSFLADSRISGCVVDRLQRGDSLRHGFRMDVHLPKTRTGTTTGRPLFPKVNGMTLGARSTFLFARCTWRKSLLIVPKL